MNKQRILFIGAGRMAEAIFSGLVQRKAEHIEEIIISNRRNQAHLDAMQERYGVTTTTRWQDHVAGADVVLLAMKPGDHLAVLQELAPLIEGQFVVTVAAGVGTRLLEDHLPEGTPVAWVMPNTSAQVGEAISIYTYGAHAKPDHKQVLEMILDGIGDFVECTEEQIHNLTAITGSAPAFLYRFAEILEEAATSFGVTSEQARKMVVQMLYGSATMLKETGIAPALLRDGVTTPGGATAAGLRVLEEQGLPNMLKDAVDATNRRCLEMAGEQGAKK
jgi:pyrroline-5-carboxylate reductase